MPPRSRKADTFTPYILDQLSSLGPVHARSMFGGKALYWNERMFGLIDEGRVYFRVSEMSVKRYEAEGSTPFEPWPGHVMRSYWEVPARVIENPEDASEWAREAWNAKAAVPTGAQARKRALSRKAKRPSARLR